MNQVNEIALQAVPALAVTGILVKSTAFQNNYAT